MNAPLPKNCSLLGHRTYQTLSIALFINYQNSLFKIIQKGLTLSTYHSISTWVIFKNYTKTLQKHINFKKKTRQTIIFTCTLKIFCIFSIFIKRDLCAAKYNHIIQSFCGVTYFSNLGKWIVKRKLFQFDFFESSLKGEQGCVVWSNFSYSNC